MRRDTQLVRGPTKPRDLAHVRPLDLSTTYRTPNVSEATSSIETLAEGHASAPNPIYARLANPNVRDFEDHLTVLEGGADSVAFASGMAAITALLLARRPRGSHVLAIPPLYGGTHHLLETRLLGTEVTWVQPSEVAGAVRPDTSLVLVETPANPTLSLTDIRALSEHAGEVPVAVDSTFATPILTQPLLHGAAYVIHSATKFLGGHGDAMGGVVATRSPECARLLRQVRIATGAVLHPLAAYLLARGLRTLGVRLRVQQDHARALVERLVSHPEVRRVYYPGLRDEAERRVLEKQMAGPGAVFAVQFTGGPNRADKFIQALRLMTPAVSLGSIDTLVQRPAALTHRIIGDEARSAAQIPDDLIRISVGLEDVEDLWQDMEEALASSSRSSGSLARGDASRLATTPHPLASEPTDPLLGHRKSDSAQVVET